MSSENKFQALEGYVPVALSSFLSTGNVQSDVYVKLDGGRMVKILKEGMKFDISRVKRYEGHNIDVLYLKNSDFALYVERCSQMSQTLLGHPNVTASSGVKVLSQSLDSVVSLFMKVDLEKGFLTTAANLTQTTVGMLSRFSDFQAILDAFNRLPEEFSRHCVASSVLSTMLSQKMGWHGSSTLETVAMAGLLQDIGFKELPMELWNKKRAAMTPEEVILYQSHPERGAEILTSLEIISPQVISIVSEHHERSSGRGFPRKLRFDRIFPLSRVCALADLLTHQMICSDSQTALKTPKEAVMYLETIHRHDFTSDFWMALHKLVDPVATGGTGSNSSSASGGAVTNKAAGTIKKVA